MNTATSAARPHGFGVVLQTPGVVALRGRLNRVVLATTDALPARLAEDVRAVLRRYAPADDDVLRLFPVPLWSFLHWAPPPGPVREHAERAHALALLLHLWDDHLVDGQLPLNLGRLHFRSALWADFTTAARALCTGLGLPADRADTDADTYLDAVGAPEEPADVPGYCAAFVRQAAIWTLVPRALEEAGAAPAGPAAVVRDFAVAWRLTDDIDDLAPDAAAGVRSAVWIAREADGGQGGAGAGPARGTEAAVAGLRARAADLLTTAEARARKAGLAGAARELALSRIGLVQGADTS